MPKTWTYRQVIVWTLFEVALLVLIAWWGPRLLPSGDWVPLVQQKVWSA